ncbi:hypothetical protein ES708_17481 [subsurface metagenome]
MTTLEKLDKAYREVDVARKKLDESLENYILARQVHVNALRAHNESN